MRVRSGYKRDSGSAGVYIPFIYIYLGRALPYPVHKLPLICKVVWFFWGEHKFYYLSTFHTLDQYLGLHGVPGIVRIKPDNRAL